MALKAKISRTKPRIRYPISISLSSKALNMNFKVLPILACVFMLGCQTAPTADVATSKVTTEAASPARIALTSQTKEIALSASEKFYALISTGGLVAAISEIKSCYNGVTDRDNFVFCLSMDMQAQRFNDTMSKRMNVPGDTYFEQDYFDDRIMVLERWYPSKSQLDYVLNQVMSGLEQGTLNEVARIEKL